VTVSPNLEARLRKDVAISAAAGADIDKRSGADPAGATQ
jgi:hypothetical protein